MEIKILKYKRTFFQLGKYHELCQTPWIIHALCTINSKKRKNKNNVKRKTPLSTLEALIKEIPLRL